jgi:hypothetical protein
MEPAKTYIPNQKKYIRNVNPLRESILLPRACNTGSRETEGIVPFAFQLYSSWDMPKIDQREVSPCSSMWMCFVDWYSRWLMAGVCSCRVSQNTIQSCTLISKPLMGFERFFRGKFIHWSVLEWNVRTTHWHILIVMLHWYRQVKPGDVISSSNSRSVEYRHNRWLMV